MTNTDSADQAILIALGSNIAGTYGSCEALLEAALARFAAVAITVLDRSSWWRSKAWPDPAEPDYVNGAALVATPLPPSSLLGALLGLEASFGRIAGARNAARTLDVDLVAYERAIIAAPGFVLPHPRALQRRFVTGPLAQILPAWRDPASGRTARELADSATIGLDAHPIERKG